MKKFINLFKKLFVYVLLFSLFLAISLMLSSCRDYSSFDSITICETINQKTLEPEKINNTFEITAKTIYAVVKYNNVSNNATYYFIWTNLDTGEKNTTEKYSFSEKKDLQSGYIVSVFNIKNLESITSPGKYRVEFCYNNKQKLKTEFEINKPVIKVISLDLANSIKEDYSPVNKASEFKPTDTIYACVKLNYLLKNNILKAKWYDSNDSLVLESPYLINTNIYKPTYIPFGLQNDKGILPSGKYKIEIYINDQLDKTENFEVVKTELQISSFEKNNIYENADYKFSLLIPDEWNYFELNTKEGFQVQLLPASENMEIGFLFMIKNDISDFSTSSYNEIADGIAEPFITEKNPETVNTSSSEKITAKDIKYYEVVKVFKDDEGIQWNIPFCFIENEGRLYILYGIVNSDMYSADSEIIFYGIINSLEF